jgi:hypothetical protein
VIRDITSLLTPLNPPRRSRRGGADIDPIAQADARRDGAWRPDAHSRSTTTGDGERIAPEEVSKPPPPSRSWPMRIAETPKGCRSITRFGSFDQQLDRSDRRIVRPSWIVLGRSGRSMPDRLESPYRSAVGGLSRGSFGSFESLRTFESFGSFDVLRTS